MESRQQCISYPNIGSSTILTVQSTDDKSQEILGAITLQITRYPFDVAMYLTTKDAIDLANNLNEMVTLIEKPQLAEQQS